MGPRLLFFTTLALAFLLAGAVLAVPWFREAGSSRLLVLFAEDTVVRRTALASALGLLVTAFVFFRPRGFVLFKSRKDKARVPPPVAGA